ncbi:MAG: hypothetical protein GIW97_00305 [Candidatus Eremiobacteraeota bacterium]|nr:hypothetical protein [Candidatus Eremiobacteraeota bacterium]
MEARDHLAMVDRILSRIDEPVCLGGLPYIVWGVVGGSTDFVTQVVVVQHGAPSLLWVSLTLMLAAVAFMIYYGMRLSRKERRGLLGRHIGNVFMISWITSLVMMLLASHIFSYWAQGAIWSLMFGAAMMYVGTLARSRISFAGGILLLLSIIAANYSYQYAGYVLAAGFIIGMGGAGVALSLAHGDE